MSKHPRLGGLVTIGVIAIAAFVGYYAILAIDDKLSEVYTFAPNSSSDDRFITVLVDGALHDISMNHQITLHTTSLSALNPIFVEVELFPTIKFKDDDNKKWEQVPDVIEVYFPNSVNYTKYSEGNYQGLREIMKVLVYKSDNPKRLYGNATIIYQFENDYGYAIISPEELAKRTIGGYTFIDTKLMEESTAKCCMFHVGSSDVTNTLHMNNIFFALTLAFVGFTFIELRPQITNGVFWSYEIISKLIASLKSRRAQRLQKK